MREDRKQGSRGQQRAGRLHHRARGRRCVCVCVGTTTMATSAIPQATSWNWTYLKRQMRLSRPLSRANGSCAETASVNERKTRDRGDPKQKHQNTTKSVSVFGAGAVGKERRRMEMGRWGWGLDRIDGGREGGSTKQPWPAGGVGREPELLVVFYLQKGERPGGHSGPGTGIGRQHSKQRRCTLSARVHSSAALHRQDRYVTGDARGQTTSSIQLRYGSV